MSKLSERAMLVSLHRGIWMGKKQDKRVTAQAEAANNCQGDAGVFTKYLVGKELIGKVAKASAALYTFHIQNTLPWADGGTRILTVDNYDKYCEGVRKLIEEARAAAAEFVKIYPDLYREAAVRLGDMFNADEYPDVEKIESKFYAEYNVWPLPEQGDFRSNLSQGDVEGIKSRMEQQVQDTVKEAVKSLWDRMQKVVKHAHEKLADPESKFHNSLVENIAEECDLLARLNLTGDADLEAVRVETKKLLAGLNPQDLRDDPGTRTQAAADAKGLLAKMAGYAGSL